MMRFAVSTAFVPTDQLPAIARAADELGYDSMAIPDHVVDLETLSTPYPYTKDGERRWELGSEWPDPWVLTSALAAVTTRLRFFTSIYVAAMRNPFQVAKSVGTAAVLSGGRVALGVGVGWCEEEFELLDQPFRARGRRTDEMLALLAELWSPGTSSFEGEFFTAPPMRMEPTPAQPVPIYVGGFSDVALARAARHDGWVGDLFPSAQAIDFAQRLLGLRAAEGRTDPFEILVAPTDAITVADFQRLSAGGVTQVMTQPWVYYSPMDAPLDVKLDGLARFRDDVLGPLDDAHHAG